MKKLLAGSLFDRLSKLIIGSREEFSMQNRAFHAISFFTLLICSVGIFTSLYLQFWELSVILSVLVLSLIILYILSRKYRQFKFAVVTYCILSYFILVANYYYNSGIIGPTFFLFFLTFQLLVAISPIRMHWVWMLLHVIVAYSLLAWEYNFPETIQPTYLNKWYYFFDVGFTYFMVIVFVYFITYYLLKNYNLARQKAESQALEIKKQHAILELQNIEKDKILAIISHDLRSPLASIQVFLELLNRRGLTDDTRDEINQQLLEQTKNTSEMLSNLLAWSQSQLKGGNIDLRSISVYETLDLAYALHQENARNKSVQLDITAPDNLFVLADQEMLQVVIRNLLNNAIKFTPNGGTIKLHARENKKGIEIIIQDNGIGIPDHKKQEIFSLNVRTTQGTHNEKGIGLGLLLCKEYIERQHGSIRFESDQNSGTTFFIQLPRATGITKAKAVLTA